MKVLVADFETTNFPELKTPPSDGRQAEIVSMGLILADVGEHEITTISEYYAIVEHCRPSKEEAEAVHGIKKDFADLHGIDKESAAGFIDCFCSQADLFVAHNVAFDLFMAKCGLAQADFDYRFLQDMPTYCTMQQARKLPGMTKYNLEHCLSYLCSIQRPSGQRHNAIEDARGCLEVYKTLQEMWGLAPIG